jgi:hypothetical protein
MPYYIDQMWLSTKDDGIPAALFGPGAIDAMIGATKQRVKIIESTQYPFGETIDFTVHTNKSVKFPLQVRIPGWCKNPSITVNGQKIAGKLYPGQFFTINRLFKNDDKITLAIPMDVNLTNWPNKGMAVERGPIVYSYPITAKVDTVQNYARSTAAFPGLEYKPFGAWNYALLAAKPADVQVMKNTISKYPWSEGASPVTLKIPAEKLSNWKLKQTKNAKGETVYQTSGFPANRDSTGKKEYITLVPYGSTFLRVTVFPGR